jgi:hypothetical protein
MPSRPFSPPSIFPLKRTTSTPPLPSASRSCRWPNRRRPSPNFKPLPLPFPPSTMSSTRALLSPRSGGPSPPPSPRPAAGPHRCPPRPPDPAAALERRRVAAFLSPHHRPTARVSPRRRHLVRRATVVPTVLALPSPGHLVCWRSQAGRAARTPRQHCCCDPNGRPVTVCRIFRFFIFLYNSRNSYKLLKYIKIQ